LAAAAARPPPVPSRGRAQARDRGGRVAAPVFVAGPRVVAGRHGRGTSAEAPPPPGPPGQRLAGRGAPSTSGGGAPRAWDARPPRCAPARRAAPTRVPQRRGV